MQKYKIEIRAGIALLAGLLFMVGARLVGAPFDAAVGVGVGVFTLTGVAFLFVGAVN